MREGRIPEYLEKTPDDELQVHTMYHCRNKVVSHSFVKIHSTERLDAVI